MTKNELAKKLGVTPQSVYNYTHGTSRNHPIFEENIDYEFVRREIIYNETCIEKYNNFKNKNLRKVVWVSQ